MRRTLIGWRLLILIGGIALLGLTAFRDGQYTPMISFGLLLLALLPFFARFEMRQTDARTVVLIAMLSAIAAVGRVPFAAMPSVQPTSFIIIIAGLVFGAEKGFMVGATAAFVSNFFLVHGPWTPWQMFAWGMMGFTAGLLKDSRWMQPLLGKLVFGFVWGFLFGWIMNIWGLTYLMIEGFEWSLLMASLATSVYFDVIHALVNVFFLVLFCKSWMKILERFKRKVSGVVQTE